MLLDERSMALTPGIYQKIMKKNFELRVVFFNDEYIAIKIENNKALDWRTLNLQKQALHPTKIPHEIEKKCIELMKRLNIIFGCFDFIVTPQNEYIFLEVNEMGQFLWIEEIRPEVKILDKFCEFLIKNDNDKKLQSVNKEPISLHKITPLFRD